MPQHSCPCPNFGVDNGNAYAIGTGDAATVADAVVAAEAAELANATTQADNLAQGHTCAAGCVLVGKLTWHLAQRAWFLIGALPNGAGGVVFRVLSFGRFTAQLKCKQVPPGVAEILGGGVGWEIRRAP
jgi:hypothetical protein